MTQNDMVRVWPQGSPERAAAGKVVMLSENGFSIAVAFSGPPGFRICKSGGVAIHPEYGIMLLAHRIEGGPWIEVFENGLFEIEEAS